MDKLWLAFFFATIASTLPRQRLRALFFYSGDPLYLDYGTVHIYTVTDVNTVIAVGDVNTVN